ncbi:hypothetical protein [Labilibaculum manganireducens]|uniref:hypothetical protein n=1 Tax=Labilibaculum manganireducens TaxID=1940525 RepID=UPI0029F59314|nr:hypothetical protein [Labilibaculum manganireducens]
MDLINILLSSLGSLASITGLIITIKKEENGGKKRNIVLFGIIFLLAVSTSILSYSYSKVTNERLKIESRKEAFKTEAKGLLKSAPSYISHYEPGENEGFIYGLLILLESNKDIYPETYNSYKKTVIERIEKADSVDVYKKRDIMEDCGNSALQFLKSLSNNK